MEVGAAWPELAEAVAVSGARVLEPARGPETLRRLGGVTTRSTLGALALHTGGLVLDEGWLRLLGGGHAGLPDLAEANGLGPEPSDPPPFLVVAQDVLGGRFAIDGGGLGVDPGEVCYFGPDTLDWSGIGVGHTAFVHWALGGGMAEFAADLRWEGWRELVAGLELDQGVSLWPPPFSVEGRRGPVSRRAVPVAELFAFHEDAAAQLNPPPPV